MTNHWHLLLWPESDGELAAFMQRLTITHVRRWQEHRGYAGLGPCLPRVDTEASPTMFKSASRGGTNKRGRAHAVYHPDLVPPNLDLLDHAR